jgi:hypothetical protein
MMKTLVVQKSNRKINSPTMKLWVFNDRHGSRSVTFTGFDQRRRIVLIQHSVFLLGALIVGFLLAFVIVMTAAMALGVATM